MPPWGKGPVQGKIHNGPQYIENNFPKLDKFNHCKVERMTHDKKPEEVGVNILHKHDKLTDEEEFQKAREVHKLNSPYKESIGDNGATALYGLLATGILLVVYVLLRGRKKIVAKSN